MSKVYVKIRHMLFWFCHYGFCDESYNDEITVYLDKNENKRIGYFDLLTEPSLEAYVDDEINKIDEDEFYDEVKRFIEGWESTHYSFIYPREEEDLASQVAHYAPRNNKGHKPVYIYVFTKLYKSWNTDAIKEYVKILDKDFLHKNITEVEIIDVPTYEEVRLSYEELIELGLLD